MLPETTGGLVVLVTEEVLLSLEDELSDSEAAGKITALAQITDELTPLMEDEALEPGLDRSVREGVRVAVPANDLSFSLRFVPDGTYFVAASLSARVPDGHGRFVGFYDPDGTGSAAPITVSGESIVGLDISLGSPMRPPPPVRLGDALRELLTRFESDEITGVTVEDLSPRITERELQRFGQIAGDDGILMFNELRRALGIPEPEPEPAVAGRVSSIDVANSSFEVTDEAEQVWTILVDEETTFGISGEQTIFDVDRLSDTSVQPVGKQGNSSGRGSQGGNQDRGNQGRGNTDRGGTGRVSRALTIEDLKACRSSSWVKRSRT